MTFTSVEFRKPVEQSAATAVIALTACAVGMGVVVTPLVTLGAVLGVIALIALMWATKHQPVWALAAALFSIQLGNFWRPSWQGRHALVSPTDLLVVILVAFAIFQILARRLSAHRSPLDVWWGLYLFALMPSLWVAHDPLRWVAGLRNILQGMLVFYLVFELIDTLPKARRLNRILLAWGGTAAFSFFYLMFTTPPGYVYALAHKLTDLPWARSNYFASFMVLLTPIGFSMVLHEKARIARYLLACLTVMMMTTIVLSKSIGATVSLGVCVAMSMIFVRQRQLGRLLSLFLLIGGLAMVGSLLFAELLPQTLGQLPGLGNLLKYRTMIQRFELWQHNLDLFMQSPLVGQGLLNTLRHEFSWGSGLEWWSLPHNYVIQTLAESGLVGLFAFGLLWWNVIRGLLKNWRAAPHGTGQRALSQGILIGMAGALMHGTVENNVLTKDFGMLLWAVIGLGFALGRIQGRGRIPIHGNSP